MRPHPMLFPLLAPGLLALAPALFGQDPATVKGPWKQQATVIPIQPGVGVHATTQVFATLEVHLLDAQGAPLKGDALISPASRLDITTLVSAIEGGTEGAGVLQIPVPRAGLYLLRVGAPGHKAVEFPVVVEKGGVQRLPDLRPTPDGTANPAPVCADARTVRWIDIWKGFVQRKEKSNQGFAAAQASKAHHYLNQSKVLDADVYMSNWGNDLLGLSKDMSSEKDKPTRALLAVCYLDLGFDGSHLDPMATDLALRYLPAESPFWSLSPQMPYFAYYKAGAARARGVWLFLGSMEKGNPDPEVRAYAILRRIEDHDAKGNAGDRKQLIQMVMKDYAGTQVTAYLPSRYPHDFK